MDWDPEIDSPATVLIVGAGPAGIEAALYARFLGYEVHVVERARVGGCLAAWGTDPLLDPPKAMSNLGLAALQAQETSQPTVENISSCADYVENYLIPVAKTDLLYQSIQINSELISLARTGVDGATHVPADQRSELEFRALIRSQKRGEYSQVFDLVLDCSGQMDRTGLATGRGLSKGESDLPAGLRESSSCGLFRGRTSFARESTSGTTILYGADLDACASAREFGDLKEREPGSRLIWLIPKSYDVADSEADTENEPGAPSMRELLDLPNQWREDPPRGVAVMDCWGVESIHLAAEDVAGNEQNSSSSSWTVSIQTRPEESLELTCDRFVNCLKPFADWRSYHRLSIGDRVTSDGNEDGTQTPSPVTQEPHLYVLGQKSSGTGVDACQMHWSDIRDQIRSAFALIGGRQDLNLYESVRLQD